MAGNFRVFYDEELHYSGCGRFQEMMTGKSAVANAIGIASNRYLVLRSAPTTYYSWKTALHMHKTPKQDTNISQRKVAFPGIWLSIRLTWQIPLIRNGWP